MKLKNYEISSGKKFKLSKYKTRKSNKNLQEEESEELLGKDIEEIAKLQNVLYAENRQSLLVILQGMDSAGKDSTIKHIMKGVNPQGVDVASFKHPSDLELEHDYLWRHSLKLPEHGMITIFNRSHYENVLISKVHPEIVLAERIPKIDSVKKVDKKFWKNRYEQIRNFEKRNIDNGTSIVKIFLHLSKDEQRFRFLERIEDKQKHWKFSSADIAEREYWDDYQSAYEDAIRETSTKDAPWYIVPADDKLFAHQLIAKIILWKLKDMNPKFPEIDKKELSALAAAKKKLMVK